MTGEGLKRNLAEGEHFYLMKLYPHKSVSPQGMTGVKFKPSLVKNIKKKKEKKRKLQAN